MAGGTLQGTFRTIISRPIFQGAIYLVRSSPSSQCLNVIDFVLVEEMYEALMGCAESSREEPVQDNIELIVSITTEFVRLVSLRETPLFLCINVETGKLGGRRCWAMCPGDKAEQEEPVLTRGCSDIQRTKYSMGHQGEEI